MRRLIDRLSAARRNDGGFTLIELLIVIIILGVLAAIVVFSVRGITDTGDEAACKANYKTAQTALEAYYANDATNSYPAALADLVPDFLATDPSAAGVDAKVKVGYTHITTPSESYTLTSGSACTP
ncbi:prepilin-type N-terminal cleavage/methylation domain-containing protein [Nocardioides sp. SLBN-35]|uniref:prepilin-type N-terminal cleavage/methylation domain-containing protein n=1 Tax=Nocardioides sp. SLBN-35 TaxID=2768445 RepID=UPI00114E33D6|nr:prepilin-type N-terminal cleavage/methylation domain-containing protein [Nocardioides sp. SLBN-35]TQK70353.1 general secretion pathway protein G [Nocardioides sp. SLBN-35]